MTLCSLCFGLSEPRRILLAVAYGKRRLKQKKFNIFNSEFCRISPEWEQEKPEVQKFSDSVFRFCGVFQSGVQALQQLARKLFQYPNI